MKRQMRKSLLFRNEKIITKIPTTKLESRKFSSTTDTDTAPVKSSFYARIKKIYSNVEPEVVNLNKVEDSVVEIVQDTPQIVEEDTEISVLMDEETVFSQPSRLKEKLKLFVQEVVVEEIARRKVPVKKIRNFDETKMMNSFHINLRSGNVVAALKAFDLMKLHNVSLLDHYDKCVRLCFDHNRTIDALEFFDEMHQLELQPKHSTLIAAYNHFERKNDLMGLLSLFLDRITPENTEDLDVFKRVIKILIKGGDIEPVIEFFFFSSKKLKAPDTVSFRSIVESLVDIGKVEEVLLFMYSIKRQGVDITAIVYNDFMNGFISKWNLGYAQVIFKEMLKCKVVPNSDTVRIMLDGLVKNKKIKEAVGFLKHLPETTYKPTYEDYEYCIKILLDHNFIIDAYYVYQTLEDEVDLMKQKTVNMMLFDGLLKDLTLSSIANEFINEARNDGFFIDELRIMELVRQGILKN